MMKKNDFKELKFGYLQNKILKEANMSVKELNHHYISEESKVLFKMSELQIKMPFISYPDVKHLEIRKTNISHMAIRRTSGIGVQQQDKLISMFVLTSMIIKESKLWYHVSFSRKDKCLPNYKDIAWIKQIFFGDNLWAIQVFPIKDEHVSDYDTCLHLWHCYDGFKIPDLRTFGSI